MDAVLADRARAHGWHRHTPVTVGCGDVVHGTRQWHRYSGDREYESVAVYYPELDGDGNVEGLWWVLVPEVQR